MSKIDRLVAERVMGWKWIQVAVRGGEGKIKTIVPPTDWEGCEPAEESTPLASDWDRAGGLVRHKFSTDIAAAWEVESTLYGRKLFIVLERDPPCEHFECVFVDYCRGYDKYKLPARVWHKSAPMAICLAALRAVGVPESEIQEAMR